MKLKFLLLSCISGLCLAAFLQPCQVGAKVYKSGFTSQKLSSSVKKRITGISFPARNGLISYKDLRYLRMRYVDFEGKVQSGEMIVNKKIAKKTLILFYQLYKMKYPIQRMVLVDAYGGDDENSMAANNTSSFNYRRIEGTNRLSKHGYGLAIDINPRINPCVTASTVAPANGKAYTQRKPSKCTGKHAKNMIRRKSAICKLFKKQGFNWGGDWNSKKDYQHFEYQ